MPFIPNTPESLLGRSDSKNPATTCRGVTSGGRPCRRPLNSSPDSSPAPAPPKIKGLRANDPRNPDLYCWQHKDQAALSSHSSPGPRTNMPSIHESGRQSLESLVNRLGIVDSYKHGKRPTHNPYGEKITHPPTQPRTKQSSFCCCFTITEVVEEEELPPRPQPRPLQTAPAKPVSSKPHSQHLAPPSAQSRPSGDSLRPHSNHSGTSQTSQYLSLIPATASPQTASQLMAELAKPISQQDEPGYIYIFWLTPESKPAAPPAEAAKSLLTPPRPDGRQRRPSDVMESYAVKGSKTGSSKKILLKIGRANNVQRRLNEWTRQCGYNISLIRYYPYVSSSEPTEPRKMPHSHKVERLVHLELAGAGLRVSDKANCEACGKAHKEWFEIDASRKGIEMVDEVVKRWSDWDEAHP
ncbi:DUF1766-domain-containing protein [Daldinia caldariorum]|uniref:DUF1766-domain-containing protein n=1 Tax=Daldinia caldariorum TaxID=326644 RepID=UPI0020071ECA|nr:DUF1766-domain-containing protein [Daldinia caldariorum]KAI1464470.1 DUF1766-domain-containing protein [Daldinia caldariorum]